MSGLPLARAQAIANSELGVSPIATRTLRLYTAAPTSTSAGTEVSGSGYVAQSITFNTADGTGTCSQSADISFPAATGSYSIVAWAVTDASGANMYVFLAFGSISVTVGSIVQFTSGSSNRISVQYS